MTLGAQRARGWQMDPVLLGTQSRKGVLRGQIALVGAQHASFPSPHVLNACPSSTSLQPVVPWLRCRPLPFTKPGIPLALAPHHSVRKGANMRARRWLSNFLTAGGVMGALLWGADGRAELKPGAMLDKATWQEAKDTMPEAILRRFASGQHLSTVITLPPEALQYGSRFRQLTEANHGKYQVNDRG